MTQDTTAPPSRVGVLGLGPMGAPIARNLLRAGRSVTVWNRTAATAEPFRALGATVAATPAEVAAPLLLSVLPDVDQLRSLLPGALESWRAAGTRLLVVMSTTSAAKVRALAADLAPAGIEVADAAMSGGDRGAQAGTLSLMVGAEEPAWRRLEPVLADIGSTIVRFGGPGTGSAAKLCNQVVVAGTVTAIAEALALAERVGLEPADVVRILRGGLADSAVLRLKEEKLLTGDYSLGGSARNQLKDLRYAGQLAEEFGAHIPLTRVLTDIFAEVEAAGDGPLDHSVVLERFRDRPGPVQ